MTNLQLDMVIRGGIVVEPSSADKMDIGIAGGIISALARPGELPRGQTEIDACGKLIIPGAVDSHVHFREPGLTYKEDFATGTKAAAAGGVTTVMVMPFTRPLTTSVSELEEKARIADGKAVVDYALQATVNSRRLERVAEAAHWGVVSFELLLAEAPEEIRIADNGTLIQVLKAVSNSGSIAGIYADDDGVISAASAALKAAGRCDFKAHAESKPPVGEALGIARACLVAESVGARIHFRQISTKIGVEIVRYMKRRYQGISAEVSPHHLLLDETTLNEMGPVAKVNPPLRTRQDCEALWEGIQDGTIDIIATDHAPHTREEKDAGLTDIWKAPAGVVGVQTVLPLMLDKVSSGLLSLNSMVRLLCEGPARLFKLYPRKGVIRVGSDADLVIIDPDREQVVVEKTQYSKAKRTPFEGVRLRGVPVLTMVRGNIVMRDGVVTDVARGKLVRPLDVTEGLNTRDMLDYGHLGRR